MRRYDCRLLLSSRRSQESYGSQKRRFKRERKLSPKECRELERLAALPDDKIDTEDVPEAPAAIWAFTR
jgi:hypothetical protein